MNGLDLLSSSLRLIGVLASGETPNSAEASDALLILNQMLDSWNAERLTVFDISITSYALIPGTQTYTLGTGGILNGVRPAKITAMSSLTFNNPSQPLELPIDILGDADWQAIPVKAVSSTYPTKCYDDGSFPFRNLSFWPIPSAACNVLIYGWTALTSFPDLTTDITFPPGYFKAIRYCLAVDLAPEYGRPIQPEVAAQAILSKAVIMSMNIVTPELRTDPALSNPKGFAYDYRTDMPAGGR